MVCCCMTIKIHAITQWHHDDLTEEVKTGSAVPVWKLLIMVTGQKD